MRVIEPHQLKNIKNKNKIKRKHYAKPIIVLLIAVGILFLWARENNSTSDYDKNFPQPTSSIDNHQVVDKKLTLKILTGDDFKNLYSSFAYPNTSPVTSPPDITGNPNADKRIIQIAESRGYKLSSLPVSNIIKIDEEHLTSDDLIQQNANIAWQDIKKDAAGDNVPLQLTSAYRSIEFQRNLFMRRLVDEGITVYGIADGYSDEAVGRVLSKIAPPGYSRHHTGYTLDFACDGVGLDSFIGTKCYQWLSNNNFEQTKKYGLVPSYPKGVDMQGPEPESWEFIWVGTSNLYE